MTLLIAACGRVPEHGEPALHGRACYACHGDQYLASSDPDHGARGFSKQCETCHETTAWRPAGVGDHGFWPLTGAHRVTVCQACHEDGLSSDVPTDCGGCHRDAFLATTNPDHEARGFATTCEVCHTTEAWRPATLDHDALWPLVGAHAAASCESCHPGGRYTGTPSACAGCHLEDWQASAQPDHETLGLSTTCEECHTPAAWRPASFTVHDRYWPLEDAHERVACATCHVDGVFGGTARECEGCHMDDYRESVNPDHEALALPTACGGCHTAKGWRPAGFAAHDRFWPIEGRHEVVACEGCHEGSVFGGTPRACEGCHIEEYRESTNPDHEALGLETACGGCHTAQGWTPAGFDAHDQFWPIVGKHVGVACEACHTDPAFASTPSECEGCHLEDHRAAKRPDHVTLELSTACGGCHTEEGWSPAGFEAHDQHWPIEGKHLEVACESCHADAVFSGTARTCEGCHLVQFEETTEPPHAAAGFPRTCETCHDVLGWTPATFDHQSAWPLDGKHATTACESCHEAEVYAGTARACDGCHLSDFRDTLDPDHEALALPTECGACHTTAGWSPASLADHDRFWPLTGAHATAACESCHVGGVFAGTPRVCRACHVADYLATVDPAHAAAGYPTTCEACHGVAAWAPARFDHTGYWPLTGAHTEAACDGCHAGEVFAGTPRACEGCHLDDYDASADPPHAADGYPTDCKGCHRTSGWAPATFVHANWWPLQGRHASTRCAGCHVGGAFGGTPTTCEACHLEDYAATRRPAHQPAGIATDCKGCHSAAGWTPATLDHRPYWPLTGAHKAAACETCHGGGRFDGTPTTCRDCHLADYQGATRPTHAAPGYPWTCETCHVTTAWAPTSFNHAARWPLTGGHAAAPCAACHAGQAFAGTTTVCQGCHLADYLSTSSPAHAQAGYPTRCEACHDSAGWSPSLFAHDQYWPLAGRHVGASCSACHLGDVFAGTPRECAGCHLAEYQATRDPPHADAGFATRCESCHDAAAWTPASFRHDLFWPLGGAHAGATCASCHAGAVYAGTPRDCEGCHLVDYRATDNPDHEALAFPTACAGCHSEGAWRPATLSSHDRFWPITGAHLGVTCDACHTGVPFSGTPRACEGCHLEDYAAADEPDHEALALSTACGGCHAAEGWRPAGLDNHDQYWPIEGEHDAVACASCHVGGVFSGTPRDCEGCHLDRYQETTDPPHAAVGFVDVCETCHAAFGWTPSTFDHDGAWPLVGAHAAATCESCHVADVYAGTPRACEGCHLVDFGATTDPDHEALALPTDCARCHGASGWSPAAMESHERFWPLLGAHATAPCQGCHEEGFAGTPSTCRACHLDDFQAALDPPHATAGYPTTCERCHGEASWRPASFDHDSYWPLTGAHLGETCSGCHAGEVFEGTPRACQGCHLDDYSASAAPAHLVEGYPTTCERCHATSGWTPATFDHADWWPLAGRHASTTCANCHVGGIFEGTATACEGCHLDAYWATSEPAHASAAIATACGTCHTAAGWTPATFDHGVYWPLTGAHVTPTCTSCHEGNVFAGTPTTCYPCHLEDYQGATRPAHAEAGYPQACEACHATAAWTPAPFDHAAFWPLTGAHVVASCVSCHAGQVFDGTPTACAGCHLPEYQATAEPPHAPAGFGTGCEACHQTAGWTPATFDHAPYWPLTGQHASAGCESCHGGGVYPGTPRDCEGCHLPDYASTTDPDHAASGYPMACSTCHQATGWTPVTFDHGQFWPLTGAHGGAPCVSCHAGQVFDGTPTACAGCHLAEYQATADPAHAPAGFGTGCEACHQTASWTPAAFDHAPYWPLAGQHASASCESCHGGGVYAGTPRDCEGCHLPEYAATTAPDHAAAGFPTTCSTCHQATGWTPATFDHGQFWPLTGAHQGAACESCHAGGVYAGTPTTCYACHQSDYAGSSNPSHAALNLSTTCQTCHTTASWDTATFPGHDAIFPITSGSPHEPFSCQHCHKTESWAAFTCTGCHTGAHNLTTMNAKHIEVTGYQATLTTHGIEGGCLHCHPDGRNSD